jgi:hypothetical protein
MRVGARELKAALKIKKINNRRYILRVFDEFPDRETWVICVSEWTGIFSTFIFINNFP